MVLNNKDKQNIINKLCDITRSFREENEPVYKIRDDMLRLVDRLYCEEYM